MPENQPPHEPTDGPTPAPEPWVSVEPTSSTAHVAGVRTHTGYARPAGGPGEGGGGGDDATRRVAEHLRLLGILSYVYGGLQVFGVLFGLFYIGLGLFIVFMVPAQSTSQTGGPSSVIYGWVFCMVGTMIVVFVGILMTLTIFSARDLIQHRRRAFCFVVAALHCLNIPLGAVLGIFTIIILSKPEAQALFERNAPRD